uniref:Uncharacterized protein n=1 Tax=Arundo donax TaxID=35708 RepID=A0A0A9BIJ3_ARUDO
MLKLVEHHDTVQLVLHLLSAAEVCCPSSGAPVLQFSPSFCCDWLNSRLAVISASCATPNL